MVDQEKIFEAIELAKASGKIKKGTNEVTKAIERGSAKLVVVADDANPKEITMHLPLLAKEKEALCFNVSSKEELGAAAGLSVSTVAIAITQEGQAKDVLKELESEKEE
ncbi:MAG: ribosomal L7Ae/L30e/S12e/Gadd45 family protein [Candidatus Woesearchaeota archaeon]